MAVEVLQSEKDNRLSRIEMRRMDIDCVGRMLPRLARRIGLMRGVNVGEYGKSWDVLKSARFIGAKLDREEPILDIGAYASEILCCLRRLRYANLAGIDLNPELGRMPQAASTRYVGGDFLRMPFRDRSFAAVTAISVIEHGFQGEALLKELSRVLRPGGYFIASVDYWPEKIETEGIRAFGMEWRVFSREELLGFLGLAGEHGFQPVGEVNLSASQPAVSWQGKRYTFAWLALRRTGPFGISAEDGTYGLRGQADPGIGCLRFVRPVM